MAEKVNLKVMRCPSCGAQLKAANSNEPIECLYCGNTIMPVDEPQAAAQAPAGVLRIEGIKTSSSALAYIELLFEERDWEEFCYAQSLSIPELDRLTESLRASSADDKNTWIACFKASYVPFVKKAEGCNTLLQKITDAYKADDPDAYGTFDAYKRVVNQLTVQQPALVQKLQRYRDNAVKYGASAQEVQQMEGNIAGLSTVLALPVYETLEQIPAVSSFISQRDRMIVAKLAAAGVDVEASYRQIQELIQKRQYNPALSQLLKIRGYADTEKLIERLDRYFLMENVLEINGKRYYFRKDGEHLELVSITGSKIGTKPVVKSIGQILTNFADYLYYLDESGKIKRYFLPGSGKPEKLDDKSYSSKNIFVYDKQRKVYLTSGSQVVELDLPTGKVAPVLGGVVKVVSLDGSRMVYVHRNKDTDASLLSVFDVEARKNFCIGPSGAKVEDFLDDHVVYSRAYPTEENRTLYIKNMLTNEPARIAENNIHKFCGIYGGRLFYFVGSNRRSALISVLPDGTGRTEWLPNCADVLLEQGGWVYFIRRAGWNSVLCRARADGSEYKIISSDIEKFVEIKNGYLYFISENNELMKVRMDGSHQQTLRSDVMQVLAVKDDKILFVSVDDRKAASFEAGAGARVVRSIYAVDFTGSGIRKLAYDVEAAKKYDDDTVYFTTWEAMFSLRMDNYVVTRLVDLPEKEQPTSSGCLGYVLLALLFFFVLFVGIMTEVPFLTVIGGLLGFIMLIVGVVKAASSSS